jgi:hypothetical protein
VPGFGHLVSGIGQYGASGRGCGAVVAPVRVRGWYASCAYQAGGDGGALSPSSAAQEDFSGPTCCPSRQWAR